jgi:Tfp pilus assembly protein PilF
MSLSFLAALLLLTPEADAAATGEDPYEACAARVIANVKEGREFAARWVAEAGGAPAQHCLALADLRAGFPKLAAVRLEELSERADAGDLIVRARILSQAALAYLEAQEVAEAARAIEAAFAMAPDEDELYLPAAKVYSAEEKRQVTIDAVTTAEKRGIVSAEGYVLRGRARYAVTQYREAADDVMAALKIDPVNIDALTLRGDLAQQGIDIRADYSSALRKKRG